MTDSERLDQQSTDEEARSAPRRTSLSSVSSPPEDGGALTTSPGRHPREGDVESMRALASTAAGQPSPPPPPPRRKNPYAQRRAPPELYRGQPWGVAVGQPPDPTPISADLRRQSPLSLSVESESDAGGGQDDGAESGTVPTTLQPSSGTEPNEDGSAPVTAQPPPPPGAATAKQLGGFSGGGVPPWERLPSRNLTFRSAEILSVTECRKHAPSYGSVRVLGVLAHKVVHDDATVSLVLQDPLARTSTTSFSCHPPGTRNSNRRPALKSAAGTAAATTASGPSRALSPLRGGGASISCSSHGMAPRTIGPSLPSPAPRTRSIIRAQPLRSRASAAAAASLADATTPGQVGGPARKRPRSGVAIPSLASKPPPPPTPPQPSEDPLAALAAALAGPDSLWVVADPNNVSVQPFVVGDLVTVLGEVVQQRRGGTNPPAAAGGGPANNHDHGEGGGDRLFPPWWVRARILRDSSGTNAALFHRALQARRKTLRESAAAAFVPASGELPEESDRTQAAAEKEEPQPGWGPPPYPDSSGTNVN